MINVDGGKVDGISWDSNCVCSTCYQDQCHTGCASTGCSPVVKTYVTWTGTDSDSSVMLSAANRYSELSKYSTGTMYDNVAGRYSSYCSNGNCDVPSISIRV